MRLMDRFAPIIVKDRDDLGSNASRSISEVLDARFGRRQLLQGAAAGAAAGLFGTALPGVRFATAEEKPKIVSTLTFEELEHGIDEKHHVAKGYSANVLVRWGGRIAADSPEFDLKNQTGAAQEKQFGYNCDFIAYMPLPAGSSSSESGLLCVNHEYTNAELMFPGLTEDDKLDKLTREQVEVEMASRRRQGRRSCGDRVHLGALHHRR